MPAGSLAGKAVLIRRGTCGFYVKAINARTPGAAAVVLYNNAAGRVEPTVAGTPAITIPVVAITAAEGVLIDSRIAGRADDADLDEPGSSPRQPPAADFRLQLVRPDA